MATQIIPPPPKPIETDIELFARAYFNIELTKLQMDVIAAVASGKEIRGGKRTGLSTANKVLRAYIAEGIKPGGRARLPRHLLPAHPAKMRGYSQERKILELLKRPNGAYNFELARYALKYTSVISDLRKDGYQIPHPERQYLKNGKASNTYLYRLIGD